MSFEVGRLSAALTLDGVEEFNNGLDAAGRKLEATGKTATKTGDLYQDSAGKWRNAAGQFATAAEQAAAGMGGASQSADGLMKNIQRLATESPQALTTVGSAFTKVGLVAGAASGLALTKWANFDQAMSNVSAATHESTDSMKLLETAALAAGARTVFSATEAANAVEELAKAGVSTADILGGGLDGALDLAAAGGLGVADAAGIAATALKTFGLEGSDMSHVADLLAAGAGKAMGDVTDLSSALNQSSMVAHATGLSIEETTGTLAAFASQGLLGSDAGTSFKSMLQSLTPTSAQAKKKMDELGISAYDAQGNFIGMAEFAGNLQNGLKDLTTEQQQSALKTIFGSDAIRAATVLYNEGEQGIRDWTDAVDDQGYAADTAAERLDNLKGDLEGLGGALDTALIQTGSAANDALRGMVQIVTQAVDAYNELPAPLQGAALAGGILTAAVGLLGGGLLIGIPKIAAYKTALETLGMAGGRTSKALAAVGKAAGAIGVVALATAAVDGLSNELAQKLSPSAEETTNKITTAKTAIEAFAGAAEARFPGTAAGAKLGEESISQLAGALDEAAASSFWNPIDPGLDSSVLADWRIVGEEIGKVAASDLPAAQEQFMAVADAAKLNKDQMSQLISESEPLKAAFTNQATTMGLAADDATLLKLALGEIGPAAKGGVAGVDEQVSALDALNVTAAETQDAISALADEISGFGSAQFDVREANRQLEESYDSLNAVLAENGANFDIDSEAGRKVQSTMDSVAKSTNDAAASLLLAGGSQEEVNAKLAEGKSRLIDTLAPYMESREAAAAYVEQLELISPEKVTNIVAEAEKAQAEVDAYNAKLAEMAPEKVVKIDADAEAAFEGIEGVNIASIDGKTAYVYGDNEDAQAKIDAIIAQGIPGKTSVVSANDDDFWTAWVAIQQAQMEEKVVNIVRNVTETLTSIGKANNHSGGMYDIEGKHFAAGGFPSGMYQGVNGGIHKAGIDGTPHVFAEAEMGVPWEAYISGKPEFRERNIGLAVESLRRLGVDLEAEAYARLAFPPIQATSVYGTRAFAQGDVLARRTGAQSPISTPNKPIRVERNKARGPIANTINVGVEASTNDIKNLASILDRLRR